MRRARTTIKAPLVIGFGALLLLIATATAVTLTKSFSIFDLLEQTHERHYAVADALHRLRSDLYLAGILKRDFLLDRVENLPGNYGEQFNEIQRSANESLRVIEQLVDAESKSSAQQLRSEVAAYIRPLREAGEWDPVLAPGMRSMLLRRQLAQRTAALQIASEIERLNREALSAQQQRIAEAEADFRRALLAISMAGVLMGLIVAISTIVYTRKLERQSEEAGSELRRLSQHVVKAQEHERRSISRELHDEVGQMLTGLRMELANLDGPALRQQAADYQRLQEAKQLTERTLQCVRNLSLVLRPSMLDDLGLAPALNWQAREFSRRSGIPVNLQIRGEVDDAPDEVRTCVYRVVQEALTNVARHANATRIAVLLTREGNHLKMELEDNGTGFDVKKRRPRGLGLVGLQERVAELSGTVRIDSRTGEGTRITVNLPLSGVAA